MTDFDETELRRLLTEATPSPWRAGRRRGEHGPPPGVFGIRRAENDSLIAPTRKADAALIVAAVNSLPALLDRLDRLEAVADDLRDILDLTGGWTMEMPNEERLGRIGKIATAALSRLSVPHEEGGDPGELSPEQEREHGEVVRKVAAEHGFPLPDWTPETKEER